MCIIAFQYKTNPQYDLIIVANRDEFYERPTKPAYLWDTSPRIFGGQDERLGGTWMGVTDNGRFAAITNYRNPKLDVLKPISRGKIATDFLLNTDSARAYADKLRDLKDDVGPYNVLLYDGTDFLHYNNIYNEIIKIAPGTHTLCNATLNTTWPKTEKLTASYKETLNNEYFTDEQLFAILQNRDLAADHELPATGVPFEMEKALSAIFVKLPEYGTRSSAIIKLNQNGADYTEQTYINGEPTAKTAQHIAFQLEQNC